VHFSKAGRIKKAFNVAKAKPQTSKFTVPCGESDSVSTSIVREISQEDLMALPIKQYTGKVILVATPEDLALAADDLRHETIIGFDTETQPVFRKGQGQKPPSLVQLASANAVYLFQLSEKLVLPLLSELLSSAQLVKAGVAVAGDIAGLKRIFAFDERGMMDIGLAARNQGLKQTGLRHLAALLLGIRVCKGCRTSNWGARVLSQQQIAYAATDAWVGRELYLDFQRRGCI
jgi:ribonuclease D